MMKPSNTQPSLKDKKVKVWWDLSVGLAVAGGNGVLFMDPFTDHEVIDVSFVPSVTLSGTVTNVVVGTLDTNNKYAASQNVVAVAGNRVVGVVQSLTLQPIVDPTTLELPAGTVLVAVSSGTADTGEGLLVVTLRPRDMKYTSSKRPSGDAD